ncbi:MAG: hypothetical protein A2X35_10600 [Elusimicrobia bacterium GWA2_61_42]|nr:MAG: hypothetical protein A2X35_10600 [Elusimicrobia bacterium GWA2_61_42]OGR74710.1 MAG: hypothetical protein A2X38_02565 [Elusimicrobia bacterium GWC2_61_25]
MKTKNASVKQTARDRKQVLILVPSIPSPRSARREKTAYEALTLVAAGHEVLCLPEDKPLSAKLDEAALASRGVAIYAFPSVTRADVSGRLKTLITANPGLELIGFVGLEAMRRHLVDARLFASAKRFFAVLGREDVAALGGKAGAAAGEARFRDADKNLLSCCDAVFCEHAADAEFLKRVFGADARGLASISGALAKLGAAPGGKPVKLGVISPSARPPAGLQGAFAAARQAALGKGLDLAAVNKLLFEASPDIPAWAVISRPYSACGALWLRLKSAYQTFPNAGLVLPSPAVLKSAGARPPAGVILEAASLNRQGMHSEPLLVDDLPLVLVRAEAFRRVGGFDTRFSSASCAWTDLGLRMRQAGFRVITAEDAVVSSRPPAAAPGDLNIDLLVHKWCADGLSIMELLVFELGGRQP